MTPIIYTYKISIKRVRSHYLNNIPYQIICLGGLAGSLLPGETYEKNYYSNDDGHVFKVVANTKYGYITSNEIFIPYKSDDVAFEIITERDDNNAIVLRMVQVPLFDSEVIRFSSLVEINEKSIIYRDPEGNLKKLLF